MKQEKPSEELLDRAVREVMNDEEAKVDGHAFLARLKAQRRRPPVHRRPLLAAAAVLVVLGLASVLVLNLGTRGSKEPEDLHAAAGEATAALWEEFSLALEGARGAGAAALSAGESSLRALSATRLSAPDLSRLGGRPAAADERDVDTEDAFPAPGPKSPSLNRNFIPKERKS